MKKIILDNLARKIQQLENDSDILETLEEIEKRNKEYLRSNTITDLEISLIAIELNARKYGIGSELYVFAKPTAYKVSGVTQKYRFRVIPASHVDTKKKHESRAHFRPARRYIFEYVGRADYFRRKRCYTDDLDRIDTIF